MKKDIHPNYQEVLFIDSSTGNKFICGSAVQTKQKETHEGKEYPVVYVSVSSASHPFFTGGKQFIDTEGRVDKFLKRYAKPQQAASKDKEKQEEKKKEEAAPKKGSKKKA